MMASSLPLAVSSLPSQLGAPGAGAPGAMDLNSLLRQSMGLVSHMDQGVPSVLHRSLDQLDATSRKLARQTQSQVLAHPHAHAHPHALPLPQLQSQVPTSTQALAQSQLQEPQQTQIKAQLFLASCGVDVSQHARTLSTIDMSRTYEPMEPASELDVDAYLEHHHTTLLNTAIQQVEQQTGRAFARAESAAMEAEWEAAKREIMESMGFRGVPRDAGSASALTFGANRADATRTQGTVGSVPPSTSTSASAPASASASTSTSPALSLSGSLYALCIKQLNHARHQHRPFPICAATRETRQTYQQQQQQSGVGSSVDVEVLDVLDMVSDMIGEGSEPISPYQYHHDYVQQTSTLRQILMDGVKTHLQRTYAQYINKLCAAHPQSAQRSGVPGTIHTVRGYINCIRHTLPDTVEGVLDGFPLWVQIFYCIRCGDWRAALELCQRAQQSGIEMTTFTEAVHHTSQGKQLAIPLWKRLCEEYHRDVVPRERCDPYRVALYHMLGRVKPSPHVDLVRYVVPTTEDYMWLKLMTLWEQPEPLPDWLWNATEAHTFTLTHLQQTLLKRGESHFNPDGRGPLRYFRVLLMCQLFEHAIYYLVRTEYFELAVHVAIILDQVGLIRRTRPEQDLLISSPSGSSLNYIRIIRKYVSSFANISALDAFHYLLLLRSPDGQAQEQDQPDQLDASYDAMEQLILDTKEYHTLIGIKTPIGWTKRGCVLEYYAPSAARAILTEAASRASELGQSLDAIQLYQYADDMNEAVTLLIKHLVRLVHTTGTPGIQGGDSAVQQRALLRQQAHHIIQQQQTLGSSTATSTPSTSSSLLSPSLLSSLQDLSGLCDFFDLYAAGLSQYDSALEILSNLKLIPVKQDGSDVQQVVQQWEQQHTLIRTAATHVALATMEIYYAKYKQLRGETSRTLIGQTPRDGARQKLLWWYRGVGRSLINMVGLLAAHIGTDVHAKLVRLEALMP